MPVDLALSDRNVTHILEIQSETKVEGSTEDSEWEHFQEVFSGFCELRCFHCGRFLMHPSCQPSEEIDFPNW